MKKKLIIGILVAVLLAGAGSVGVYHHNQAQKQKAIAVEKEKEEKAKDARFKKLQSEYDTAEMQTENSLYPNADGMMPDDATMNSSRDGKKKELVAFQEKIKNKKMTKKEETDFHTFVSSVKDIYNASKTAVDTLHTEVVGMDPNGYGTYYTDANKTDTEKNLSAYDKDYKDGKYRDAYTDLTNVKTIYVSADTAKKQAEAEASKQAEEQAAQAQAQKSAKQSANNSTGSTKKAQTSGKRQSASNSSSQTSSPAPANDPQPTQTAPSSESNEDEWAGAFDTQGYKNALEYANAHGYSIEVHTLGNNYYWYTFSGSDGSYPNIRFNADGSSSEL
jgi:DNA repair exonuclease SbcCD ATPase subunit